MINKRLKTLQLLIIEFDRFRGIVYIDRLEYIKWFPRINKF